MPLINQNIPTLIAHFHFGLCRFRVTCRRGRSQIDKL